MSSKFHGNSRIHKQKRHLLRELDQVTFERDRNAVRVLELEAILHRARMLLNAKGLKIRSWQITDLRKGDLPVGRLA